MAEKKLKKEPEYTKGRAVAATMLGGLHTPFAAKEGKKLKGTAKVVGGTWGGSTAGGVTGAVLTRKPGGAAAGSNLGSFGGAYGTFRHNNKRGYYKKQVKKNNTVSAFGVDHGG